MKLMIFLKRNISAYESNDINPMSLASYIFFDWIRSTTISKYKNIVRLYVALDKPLFPIINGVVTRICIYKE